MVLQICQIRLDRTVYLFDMLKHISLQRVAFLFYNGTAVIKAPLAVSSELVKRLLLQRKRSVRRLVIGGADAAVCIGKHRIRPALRFRDNAFQPVFFFRKLRKQRRTQILQLLRVRL